MSDANIACIERYNGDRLIVKFNEFRGEHFCDIRVHYVNERGQVLPTQKGISIRCEEICNVTDALERAWELAKKVKR